MSLEALAQSTALRPSPRHSKGKHGGSERQRHWTRMLNRAWNGLGIYGLFSS